MAAGRIKILKKQSIIQNGRQEEQQPKLHYVAWCEISSLYGQELYRALEIRMENTIVFEVRYCRKIKEVQLNLKDYYIEYEKQQYNIYAVDLRANDKQYAQLKANRVE
nr:MAG TPA: Putative head tail adaptor [Caudoviricetes sp.]